MAYAVRLTARAEADAYHAFEYIRQIAPGGAERWQRDLFGAIQTLTEMPKRCPLIPEAEAAGHTVRHLLYGNRTGTYRIIFDAEEDSKEGPRVRALRTWHGARDSIIAADVEQA